MHKKKTAIMGFGNPVRSDDAIGIYVIAELKKIINNNENIQVFDMGTSGFEILFQLKNFEELILVDGVINSGDEDGSIFKVPYDEIKASIQDDPMVFLHTIKWDQALSYAKKIMQQDFPENNIEVFLIAITNTKLEMQLSEKIKQAGDKVVEHIRYMLAL